MMTSELITPDGLIIGSEAARGERILARCVSTEPFSRTRLQVGIAGSVRRAR
jgi:hypothetical protein